MSKAMFYFGWFLFLTMLLVNVLEQAKLINLRFEDSTSPIVVGFVVGIGWMMAGIGKRVFELTQEKPTEVTEESQQEVTG